MVVPGWKYKAAVQLMKHTPRFVLERVAVKQQRRLKRD